MLDPETYIHPLAEVASSACIGRGTRIWRHVCIREYATLGEECQVGQGVYIDARVCIGSRVKLQNYASVFEGVTLEDGVFVGPHVCFTNDRFPRAITPTGRLKGADDWTLSTTLVHRGASLGAHAVIRCGLTIGTFALIGSGAVVTHDIPSYTLALGNPARLRGYVCRCGRPLQEASVSAGSLIGHCSLCGKVEFAI